MRKSLVILSILLLLLGTFVAAASEPRTVFSMSDPRGDDFGSGTLQYPSHPIFLDGLFDLGRFAVSEDTEYVYFDITFQEVTNPFNAPEGYFHQRIEIYIDTTPTAGSSTIQIGDYTLAVPEDNGWDVRLSGGAFDETRAYLWENGRVRELPNGVSSYLLDDGKTIQLRVDAALLPQPSSTWQYYVLVGAFDALAQDNWRTASRTVSEWQLMGEGAPVIDLLAPRWGLRSQRTQLQAGLLYPANRGWFAKLPWLWIMFGCFIVLGILFWIGFLVRRWKNG